MTKYLKYVSQLNLVDKFFRFSSLFRGSYPVLIWGTLFVQKVRDTKFTRSLWWTLIYQMSNVKCQMSNVKCQMANANISQTLTFQKEMVLRPYSAQFFHLTDTFRA